MPGTVSQYMQGTPVSWGFGFRTMLQAMVNRLSSQTLSTPGLAIKAASNVLAKAGTAFHAVAGGVPVKFAANTDMASLAGTVTNAKHNVFCFFVDSAGALTTVMGTEGASFGTMKFPSIPSKKAMIGYVYINPTGTGNFVGGTTPLDDATVVPNAVYVNTLGAFDPNLLP